jgi:hypothetical protein
MTWIFVDDIKHNMRTTNRKPIKTEGCLGSTTIWWKCHGINQHGRRIHWEEVTYTVAVEPVSSPYPHAPEIYYQTTRYVGPYGVRI